MDKQLSWVNGLERPKGEIIAIEGLKGLNLLIDYNDLHISRLLYESIESLTESGIVTFNNEIAVIQNVQFVFDLPIVYKRGIVRKAHAKFGEEGCDTLGLLKIEVLDPVREVASFLHVVGSLHGQRGLAYTALAANLHELDGLVHEIEYQLVHIVVATKYLHIGKEVALISPLDVIQLAELVVRKDYEILRRREGV